jgi:lysophospholipase L1-like esterase
VIFALCALGAAASSEVPPLLTNVRRIVMMGDSITQGGGEPKGYVTLFGKTLRDAYPQQPIEIINVGIGGQKAPDMLARFQRDVLDKHPDLVTISVGVNDVWHDFRTPEWTARVAEGNSGRGVKLPDHIKGVDAMIQAAQKANVKVVLLSPTLVFEDLDCAENKRLGLYVRAQAKLAAERKVGFIDLNKTFRRVVDTYQKAGGKRQLLLTTDGVHLNDAGNALMAGAILRYFDVPVPNQVKPE